MSGVEQDRLDALLSLAERVRIVWIPLDKFLKVSSKYYLTLILYFFNYLSPEYVKPMNSTCSLNPSLETDVKTFYNYFHI